MSAYICLQVVLSSNWCILEELIPQFPCQDVVSCRSNDATDVPSQSESNKGTQAERIGRKINNSKEKNRVSISSLCFHR